LLSSVAQRWELGSPYTGLWIATTTSTPTYGTGAYGACTIASMEETDDQFGRRTVAIGNAGGSPNPATTFNHDLSANWVICQPLVRHTRTTVTTSARHGQAETTDFRDIRQTYTYNARRQVLTEHVEAPHPAPGPGNYNGILRRTTTYAYEEAGGSNSFGNLKSVTVSGGSGSTYVSPRATTTAWSADGYFPASVTNPQGHTVTTITDAKHGQPTQVTDPNAVDAFASYDAFGRKSASWVEDLPVQNIAYAACGGCYGSGAYTVTTTQPGSPTTVVTYDPLNRAIASETQGFSAGDKVYGRTRFDAAGRTTWQREPDFLASDAGPRTDFTYDALDRVTLKLDPKGLSTGTVFEGGITHVTAVGDGITQTAVQETDSAGRLITAIDAYSNKTHFRYDALGNPVRIVDGIGAVVTATYNGLGQKTALNDPDLGVWSYSYNILGELKSQTDARNKTSTFIYDSIGRMIQRDEPETGGNCTTTWTYDTAQYGIGKIAGVAQCGGYYETYSYDAKGRLTNLAQVVDLYLYETTTTYDSYGRVDVIWYPEQTSIGSPTVPGAPTNVQVDPVYSLNGNHTLSWGAPAGGAAPTSYKLYRRKLPNTSWGNAITVSATTFSRNYTNLAAGDHEFKVVACAGSNCSVDSAIVEAQVGEGGSMMAGGGMSMLMGESRFGVKQVYNAQGYLSQVQNANTSSSYWTAGNLNAYGAIQSETFGNGVASARTFKPGTPFVETISTGGTVQDLNYAWNAFGQLINRTDDLQGLDEDFTYDLLNRVRTGTLNFTGGAVPTLDVTYNAVGNILTKLDVSGNTSYTYPAATASRPHAVTAAWGKTFAYDNNGNMQTRNGSPITWTVANLLKRIDAGTNYAEFRYGPNRARFQQQARLGSRTEVTTFVGSLYEIASRSDRSRLEYRYQVTAGAMPVARVTEYSDSTPSRTEYMHRDHLGSVDVVTNSSGTAACDARMSFDAHGTRRVAAACQGNSWRQLLTYASSAAMIDSLREHTTRGFTDHEMLDGVGVVHMNGRVYDPQLGRFLSVDPVFQFPTNTQSLNPYTYALNTPLSLTDPSGLTVEDAQTEGAELAQMNAPENGGGSTTVTNSDGSTSVTHADGSESMTSADGSVTMNWGTDGSVSTTVTVNVSNEASGAMGVAGGSYVQIADRGAERIGAPANRETVQDSGSRKGEGKKLERDLTEDEKEFYKSVFNGAKAETEMKLGETLGVEAAEALLSLRGATVVFELDKEGPNDAEMTVQNAFSDKADMTSSGMTITVYKGAYETYLYGSPAAKGYILDIPSGYVGVVALITHESSHGVMSRNYYVGNSGQREFRDDLEPVADQWVNQVWNGFYK
jgi:RHS repeat-associated protein